MQKYCEDDITRALGIIQNTPEGGAEVWNRAFMNEGLESSGEALDKSSTLVVNKKIEILKVPKERSKKLRLVLDVVSLLWLVYRCLLMLSLHLPVHTNWYLLQACAVCKQKGCLGLLQCGATSNRNEPCVSARPRCPGTVAKIRTRGTCLQCVLQ